MMQQIGAMAAMTRDRVIGIDNAIPWHYSEDFKRLKRVTMGGIIIMGRKTWESIGSKALPGRRNIVITRAELEGIEHYCSIKTALKACSNEDQTIWFLGGGQIYQEALNYCDFIDITYVPDIIDPSGATLFPEIDGTIWQAGERAPLAEDPRLSIQQFTRISA